MQLGYRGSGKKSQSQFRVLAGAVPERKEINAQPRSPARMSSRDLWTSAFGGVKILRGLPEWY